MTHSTPPKRGQRTEKHVSRKEATSAMGSMMNRKVAKTGAMKEQSKKKHK